MNKTRLSFCHCILLLLPFALMTACKHDPVLTVTSTSSETSTTTTSTTTSTTTTSTTTNTTTTSTTTNTVTTEDVCFSRDVLPLFVSNCTTAGCHDATTRAEGYNLTTYGSIMAGIKAGSASTSKLYREMSSGQMPPYPKTKMTAAQLAIISKWINAGASNGTCVTSACDTATVTFSGQISSLIQSSCIGCHSSTNSSGGVSLQTYAGVKTVVDNGLLNSAMTGANNKPTMPPNVLLSDCQKAQVLKWIRQGGLNN